MAVVQYCSSTDVKHTVRQFTMDFDRNDPAIETAISEAIDEASDMARHLLEPRYSITAIDSNIPEALKSFTKLMSSVILLSSFGQVSGGKIDEQIARLTKRAKVYKYKILNGKLLNSDGTKIEANSFNTSEPLTGASTEITELFEDGNRGY